MLKKSPFNRLKRKSLKRVPLKKHRKQVDHEEVAKMRAFFLSIWERNSHYCTVCGKGLGSEPFSYHFHHVIPKQRQKIYDIDITYDEKNIVLVCLDCHSMIEMGSDPSCIRTIKSNLSDYYEKHRIVGQIREL